MNDTRTRQFGTANAVLQEARIYHDPFDEFGWVQGWRFSIAQYLTDQGEHVSEFRGAAGIREDFEYAALVDLGPNVEETRYALKILDRYREWLRLAGRDY